MNKNHRLNDALTWCHLRAAQFSLSSKHACEPIDDKESGSCVYFIQGGPYVKIGIAKHPAKRLHELQTGNPYDLVLLRSFRVQGAAHIEHSLHKLYKAQCVRGEWFALNADDIARIVKAESIVDVVRAWPGPAIAGASKT